MKDAQRWIHAMNEELSELADNEVSKPHDAWRVLVLVSRLLQSPFSEAIPPQKFLTSLTQLSEQAYKPKPALVLECLDELLDEDDDPWGQLLDAILNIDDTAGILWLMGRKDEARELSNRTAGLISISPLRVLDLGDFATMRLSTIREGNIRRNIWESIEAAPALAVTNSLPSHLAQEFYSQAREHIKGELIPFPVPEKIYQAAASSAEEDSYKLGPGLWLENNDGRMSLEYRPSILSESTPRFILVSQDSSSGEKLAEEMLELKQQGKTFYGDLGPWSGAENQLQRLISKTNQPLETIRIQIQVKHD